MACIYPRDDSPFFWVKWKDPHSGAWKRKSLKTSNKREAELLLRKYNALEAGIDPNSRVKGKPRLGQSSPEESISVNPTFEVFWPAFEKWAKMNKRTHSVQNDLEKLNEFIGFKNPKTLGDVRRKDVEKFKEAQIACGISKGTVNSKLRTLKAIWNRAIKMNCMTAPTHLRS